MLEGAAATGQPRGDFAAVEHKVQDFTFGRLPLPAARILGGKAPSHPGLERYDSDPTQRCYFIEVGGGGRFLGA